MPASSHSRLRLFKATIEDSGRLEALYAEKSREGSIQINLTRNPDFFRALQVEGFENGIYAVEDTENGVLAGTGIRHLRKCYVNGEIHTLGYLSSLRVAENYRKSRAMAMIFSQLRKLYLDKESPGYLCSVFNSNKKALQLLTSGKGGLPLTKIIGQYNTFVFKPSFRNSGGKSPYIIRQATTADIPALVRFLNEEGSKRQFFPVYTARDFEPESGTLQDLKISDIHLAFKDQELLGCCALWDQTHFRQWKVDGYAPLMGFLRLPLNFLLGISRFPKLPPPQQHFPYRLLSLTCIKNDNMEIFKHLLNSLMIRHKSSPEVLISAGFFDHDPLIQALPKFRFTFKSTIFIGYWEESNSFISSIDLRLPYLESGSL